MEYMTKKQLETLDINSLEIPLINSWHFMMTLKNTIN